MALWLGSFYRLLDAPEIYALNQRVGLPTTERYRSLVEANVQSEGRLTLDLGCGIGNFRESFRGPYVGIDINPRYIDAARKRFSDRFEVMDCTDLSFPDASFDEVVTIATTHHLDDAALARTVREALRVLRPGGHLHIVDAVLPASNWALFKQVWFRLDRGAFPRHLSALGGLVESSARVSRQETLAGPLHDVAYLRIAPLAIPSAASDRSGAGGTGPPSTS
ncbi:MAG: class I SAM-dependent methyltransferase [Acetobacteraceae bacterium]